MLIDSCEQLKKVPLQTKSKETDWLLTTHDEHVRIMSGLFCLKSPLQKWLKMGE
jgi:hypothetical protein